MRKTHFRLLMAAGSMLAAGAIALSGTLAATAAPSSSSASGIEHFQFMSTSATATRDTVIAHGVFTAGGVDITTQQHNRHAEVPQRHDQAQAFTRHRATVLQPAYLPDHRSPARHLHAAERDRQVRRDQRPREVPAGHPGRWRPVTWQVHPEKATGHFRADHPRLRAGTPVTAFQHPPGGHRQLSPRPARPVSPAGSAPLATAGGAFPRARAGTSTTGSPEPGRSCDGPSARAPRPLPALGRNGSSPTTRSPGQGSMGARGHTAPAIQDDAETLSNHVA